MGKINMESKSEQLSKALRKEPLNGRGKLPEAKPTDLRQIRATFYCSAEFGKEYLCSHYLAQGDSSCTHQDFSFRTPNDLICRCQDKRS